MDVTTDSTWGREIFEAVLSSPSVEAAEAWALLGTCKAARSVGGAASLKQLRAVALVTTAHKPLEEQYAVPFVCDLFPYEGGSTEFYGNTPEYRWPNASAIPMGYVFTRDVLYPKRNDYINDPGWNDDSLVPVRPDQKYTTDDELAMPGFKLMSTHEAEAKAAEDDAESVREEGASGASVMTASTSLPQLRALLRRCPNVISLRLCNPDLPSEVRSFLATELGALAPKLEVLDLSCPGADPDPLDTNIIAHVSDLHAALASLPNLRILLADAGTRLSRIPLSVGDHVPTRYFSGISPHTSLDYVRYPPRMMDYMAPQDVASMMRDVNALLVACPALRILDFTACAAEWYNQENPGANRSFFSKLRRKVKDDDHGASRLTHIFAKRHNFNEYMGPPGGTGGDWVFNVLDQIDAPGAWDLLKMDTGGE